MKNLTSLKIVAGITFLVALALAPEIEAAKSTGTGGGKIYFFNGDADATYTMNSDGTGKTPIPANTAGEPSRALHGGYRWIIQAREISGEFYPGGSPRRELFAVRDDGNEAFTKQLTDQPDLERTGSLGNTRWATDATLGVTDGVVSWIARRWDLLTGTVIEGGIYAEEIVFDGSGNVIGLSAQPAAPLVPAALVDTSDRPGLAPDIRDHDWSPSGSELVFALYSRPELRVANLSGATRLLLADSGFLAQPVWSPAGTKIAFASSGGIETINPNGTKRSKLQNATPWTSVYAPVWSPTGSHLAYRFSDRQGGFPYVIDVYRTSASGGSPVNLTADIASVAILSAWR